MEKNANNSDLADKANNANYVYSDVKGNSSSPIPDDPSRGCDLKVEKHLLLMS